MTNRHAYYEKMKRLAREKRELYGVTTAHLGLRELRKIYKAESIRIDLWPYKLRKIRAAYFVIDGDAFVLVNRGIRPVEPRIFSLAHELKHHYVDQELAACYPTGLGCQEVVNFARAPVVEIGAEVFAAEFIFPESEFHDWAVSLLNGQDCSQEVVVELKRACPANVSYQFIVKRLERLGFITPGRFRGTQWRKLEDSIYGVPFYRRRRR